MKLSRTNLGFMSILGAGLLLVTATVLMPAAKTYGLETDKVASDDGAGVEAAIRRLSQPQSQNPPVQVPAAAQPAAPLPPAAPLDPPAGGNLGAAAGGPTALPSAGSGGYLNAEHRAGLGYLFMGVGIALLGSGSLVWAYSRKLR